MAADQDNSVSTFISSLAFNIVVAAAILVVFCVLRPRFKRVYAPRTYAVSKEKRSPPIGAGVLAWVTAVLRLREDKIIERVGLDTYMFLRYMRSMFVIFTVLSFLSLVTILPVNILGDVGATKMARLTIANVSPDSKRLWVHIVFFMVFVGWVMRNIFLELKVYSRLRVWWLTHPSHAAKVGASTIMVSTLPQSLADSDDRIRSTFDVFPGGVRQVVANRDCSELQDIVDERDALAAKLEGLLTAHAAKCEKARKKADAKGREYKAPKRPQLRESRIPFKGPKLDAFEFLATKIGELNQQIAERSQDPGSFERKASAFVLFRKQIAAHMARQVVLDYRPFSMNMVSLDINPDDVIWGNLNLNPYDRRVRSYISLAVTIGLVIAWSLLTAALTALVSVENLKKLPGLEKMTDNPFLGLFTGIIPAAVLAAVMALLPIILRLLLRLEGTPRKSEIDLRLLHRFFFFQVWNVYLITIFTTSILSIGTSAFKDPSTIINLIPEKVPESATPILTYILLLAFTGAAKEILQVVRLLMRYIMPLLFAKTPRKICSAETPAEFDWGTTIPTHSLIFLMGFSYSFIAPLVNCFAAVYFGLFYLVYRYQFLYVYNDANWATGGLSFPKSIKQTMVGVYIAEVYMLLMMVAKLLKVAKDHSVNADVILRVVFPALILLLTIFAHRYINDAYMPIINYLPVRAAAEIERNPKLATMFPDVSSSNSTDLDGGSAGRAASQEERARQLVYATYESLVPRTVIDFVLRKMPHLLHPRRADASPASEPGSAFGDEEKQKQKQKAPAIAIQDSGSVPMPVAHHYDAAGAELVPPGKRVSGNTDILSINSQARPPAGAVYPPATAGSDPPGLADADAPSVHSLSSATGLRQRQQGAAARSAAAEADRTRRYSMVDTGPLATAGSNELAEAFSNPALRAKAATTLWAPLDNFGLCRALHADVRRWGAGTVSVTSDGTWIDDKGHVRADVEFDPDSATPPPPPPPDAE
ncbi:phosphate metabolism protein 7 [Coemansia javaensis]|uniref:Phosphate metabolism protein 7 n=1 Tax=Coemansia javaensis TaxID=2761396 RepID=A0A9W8H1T5_9FUNG|nr:phosphate metabolism protein 7 [Coemansia javaensis]